MNISLSCWLLGRLLDGLDGVVARAAGSATDAGGYADLLLDTVGYAVIPLGIAVAADDVATWQIVGVLLATFYVNSVSWLMLSALLEKRAAGSAARCEQTSITMPVALVEGTETWEELLTSLGVSGWELVQVMPGVETTYWFKRQA